VATIEDLKHKITTASDLQSVVKTMKALAAVSVHQYEKAVESLREYDRTLEMGLQILLKKRSRSAEPLPRSPLLLSPVPKIDSPKGIVVFGSDWGMCGQFNEKIANYVIEQSLSSNQKNPLILTIGSRIDNRLAVLGYQSEACFNLPSSVGGITAVVQEMVSILEKWRSEDRVQQIDLIYNQIATGAAYYPKKLQIFPLNREWLQSLQQKPWTSRSLPTFTMTEEGLVAALFRQYFFVTLYRACAESLKSENTSRLTAMQMAEKNIQESLNELKLEFNQQRQTTITEELLDIVAGFEALTN
jgi:F-type H+-transporting ATPase subunit gamma